MKNIFSRRVSALAFLMAASVPLQVHAHRGWMLPSATVLSGNEPWVTFDAASSTDVFDADHNPMRLDGLVVTAPDGARAAPDNLNTGKFRSSFDVKLSQKGTYKVAVINEGMNAAYKLNGETKRWRGTAEALPKEIPSEAQDLQVTKTHSRNEVFVTSGKPTTKVFELTGVGLELVPVSHPNDLVVGHVTTFGLMLDGKPAAGLDVTVIQGGVRYRDRLNDVKVTTDQEGKFSLKWVMPGMYWFNASLGGDAPGGSAAKPARRVSYSATMEVLPQ